MHGLFAAYDAAARGLKVGLVDAGDFGAGVTFNHQRTLHGGLRAIQTGQVRKARAQMVERRTWARIAPHLIRPLPFIVGTYRRSKFSPLMLRAGFALYERACRGRNDGVVPELHLPRARLETIAATRKLFPGIGEKGLAGGAVWYDYQTHHPDRLTWAIALAAERAGATLTNYAEATGPLREGSSVAGAQIVDRITGRSVDVAARVTLFAAGPGMATLAERFGLPPPPPLLRAMNVLLDRPARDIAMVAKASSGRMLTAVPWRERVLVGTWQSPEPVAAGTGRRSAEELESFLREIGTAFPALGATAAQIRLVHEGLVPAVSRNGRTDLLPEPRVVRHSRHGTPGVVSLIGVKYTSARAAAEQAVDAACADLGHQGQACRTSVTALPHADIADVDGRLTETVRALGTAIDEDVAAHAASWYGTEAMDVVRFGAGLGSLTRLVPDEPYLECAVAYAAEHQAAHSLADAVMRRTAIGSAGHPGTRLLERAAEVMGGVLGWTEAERAREIRGVEARYPGGAATAP